LVKLIKRWGFVPNWIITDKLRSYGAAKREVAPGLDHWSHKGLNNRAENSHLPFRKRELVMQSFQSGGRLQRFVSMQSATRNSFYVPARRRSALTIPGVEIRGTCRLINDRHANLKSRRVNVKTPR
jgi:putative transposase